jgi:hypothetical protein
VPRRDQALNVVMRARIDVAPQWRAALAAPAAAGAGVGGALAIMGAHFAAGAALLLASVLALRWPQSIWGAPVDHAWPVGARRLGVLAVCAIAVFFRCHRLNPPGLWGDDALNGLLAFDILDGTITSPFQIVRHSHSSFHALANYPIAAAFRLFGPGLTALRLPGVVLGAICVPLLYATIAPLFGTTTALIAALFYATSPPQLAHAKALVQIITGQWFQLAALALVVRGIAHRRMLPIVVAGVPLAGCLYTYHAARIAPLVVFGYVLAVIVAARRRGERIAPPLWAAAGMLAVFALALIPAVRAWTAAPDSLFGRMEETALWPAVRDQRSLWPLWDSLWRTLLMFHYQQGPEYHWFGLGFDPAVNAVVGFLLVHGLVESVRRRREPRHLLLLLWCAVGLTPALLSTGAPRLYRAFLGTPPIYVWAALPLARLLTARVGSPARIVNRAVAVAALVAVPVIDFNYYFYRLYTHPTFRWYQGERIVEMARLLRARGPGWYGYVLADTFDASHESLRFLARAWELHLTSPSSLADVLPLPQLPERGALFLMNQNAADAAAAAEHMYPGEARITVTEPTPRSWALDAWLPLPAPPGDSAIVTLAYPVPRERAEHPNLHPAWGLDAEYAGARRIVRREPYPFYAFLPWMMPGPFRAVWRGRLTVPEPGGYALEVASDSEHVLRIDGAAVDLPSAPLAAGEHAFELAFPRVSDRLRVKIYWRPPDRPREIVPPQAFAPPPGR